MKIHDSGKVYCIRSPNTDKIYIGSTFNILRKRFSHHKSINNKTLSTEIISAGDAYIELISEHQNVNKEQLLKFEGMCIRENANCINKITAGRSGKECREDNIEKQKEYMDKFLKANPDIKNKVLTCAECGLTYKYFNRNKHEKTIKHKALCEMKLKLLSQITL